MILDFLHRIQHKLLKLRFQPIRVFCFHQVSDVFDDESMYEKDWQQTDDFKRQISRFRELGYTFISLIEAHRRLQHDYIRFRKYAVLTADDGYATLQNVLPWLNEEQIPVTLFLNSAYFDGKHFRERETERYLTNNEVSQLYKQYPLLTIGSHGWEHIDATKQQEGEFKESVVRSVNCLGKLPNFVPFFAYTWGRHSEGTDSILNQNDLIPVYMDGIKNYHDARHIHRELLKRN